MPLTFAQSLLPARVRVGGQQLAPVTLGHALLLSRIASPFAPYGGPDRDPTPGETLLALWICSRGWRAAAAQLDSRRTRLWLRLRVPTRRRTWYRDAAALRIWLSDSCRGPEVWIEPLPGSSGGAGGAEFTLQRLITSLLADLHISWHDVLDLPVVTAWQLSLTFAERHGRVRLVTADEQTQLAVAQDPAAAAKLHAWAATIVRPRTA